MNFFLVGLTSTVMDPAYPVVLNYTEVEKNYAFLTVHVFLLIFMIFFFDLKICVIFLNFFLAPCTISTSSKIFGPIRRWDQRGHCLREALGTLWPLEYLAKVKYLQHWYIGQ